MKRQEFRNLIKRELIKEAKGTSYEAKLAEIEKQGHITTLEAKIDAIAEMIDAKNDRLSLVNEDENLAEIIDKKKIKEMQKEIKQLEKTKMKLEKLYEKKTGGKKKEMVDEDASEDSTLDDAAVGVTDEKEDDLREFRDYDFSVPSREYDEDEDEDETMNEEFNLRQYMSEGRLLKEDILNKIKQIKDYNKTEDSLDYKNYSITYDDDEKTYSVFPKEGAGDSSDMPEFESSSSEKVKNFLEKP